MSEATNSFFYFAYGSNMLTARLKKRTASARFVATGHVKGRRLTFDKVSLDGSGKCDMETCEETGSLVHGVLFEVDKAQRAKLDACEGLGKGYEMATVSVITVSGSVEALSYVATKTQAGLRPYDWYKALVVEGAREHELPAEYVNQIEEVPANVGPDSPQSREAWELVKAAREGQRS